MNAPRRPRLLIVIVAFQAERTIQSVLNRIPASLVATFDVETLVIVDGPADRTFEQSLALGRADTLPFPLVVLFNPTSQGYGGDQKIGFHYAVERGFDVVALLHGDGKYAPERLPDLLAPIALGQADAVFGSRMLDRSGARRGMPMYKFAANRLLTRVQNRLLRTTFSEFHSGYRAYSTAALRRVPYHLNSSAFHFDTEIAIQLLIAGQRISEVPIPAYHSRDISGLAGLRHAKNVLMASFKARAQELSLFFDRKFDCLPSTASNMHYKPRLGFESTHTIALNSIPAGARVLDIGCAGGYFSRLLKERGCHATGVDRFPLDKENILDAFHLHDLNQSPLPVDLAAFDHAVMLDVLEHLQSPETFVDGFRASAARNPNITLIVSTANIAFVVTRLMLLFGRFNYGKRGILDMTHTRLFTFRTFRRLFEQSGYEVLKMRGVPAPFPLALGDGVLARFLLGANRFLIKISRSLFAFQIFAIVRPKHGLAYLLDHAVMASGQRAAATEAPARADHRPGDGSR